MKALCGAGGGPKGAWSAGVWKALAEAGWVDDVGGAYGVSVNAINLGYLAQEGPQGADTIVKLWETTTDDDVRKPYFLGIASLWKGGLNDITPLKHFLEKYISPDKEPVFPFWAGVGNLDTGLMEYGGWGPDLINWILASAANPIWFDPVKINGTWYTDGGVLDVTPAKQAVIDGATEIIAVLHTTGKGLKPWPKDMKSVGIIKRTLREFDMAMEARLEDDLGCIKWVNHAFNAGAPEAEGKRHIKLHVIRPAEDLDVEMPHFIPKDSMRLLEEGYEAGKAYVRDHPSG